MWYLSDPAWPEPNLLHLQVSLNQTGRHRELSELSNWQQLVSSKIQEMNWNLVLSDVSPFLEDGGAIKLLTKDNLLMLLSH